MAENSNAQEAIDLLQDTQSKLNELYKTNPGMNLRINSVFNSLINSLKHTIGGFIQTKELPTSVEREPLNSIFGKRLVSKEAQESYVPVESKEEFKTDVEKLRHEVDQIIPTLLDREPSEILLSVEELQLRAIGKKLGLPYDGVNVNSEYVNSILETLHQIKEDEIAKEQMKLNVDEHLNDVPVESKEEFKTEDGANEVNLEEMNLDELVELYTSLYGKKPHHSSKEETLRTKIIEKQNELAG